MTRTIKLIIYEIIKWYEIIKLNRKLFRYYHLKKQRTIMSSRTHRYNLRVRRKFNDGDSSDISSNNIESVIIYKFKAKTPAKNKPKSNPKPNPKSKVNNKIIPNPSSEPKLKGSDKLNISSTITKKKNIKTFTDDKNKEPVIDDKNKVPVIEYEDELKLDDTYLETNIFDYIKAHQTHMNHYKKEKCNYIYNIRKQRHPYLNQDGYLILLKYNMALSQLVWVNENHQLYRLISHACIGNISKKEYDFAMGGVSSYY